MAYNKPNGLANWLEDDCNNIKTRIPEKGTFH